jgi:ABC-type lipopolysaccharide export system ATPase subunit
MEINTIRTEQLVKKYRSRTVVNDVSFEVKQERLSGCSPERSRKDDLFLHDCRSH